MSVAITFSGMLARRPTVSDLFRRPERENRPLYTVSSVGDVNPRSQARYPRLQWMGQRTSGRNHPRSPATGASFMSVHASTKTSRKPNLDLEDGIEYPSSDGKPMGETGTHARVALMNIYGVLDPYFMNNPRVAVHANMFIYYVQGD